GLVRQPSTFSNLPPTFDETRFWILDRKVQYMPGAMLEMGEGVGEVVLSVDGVAKWKDKKPDKAMLAMGGPPASSADSAREQAAEGASGSVPPEPATGEPAAKPTPVTPQEARPASCPPDAADGEASEAASGKATERAAALRGMVPRELRRGASGPRDAVEEVKHYIQAINKAFKDNMLSSADLTRSTVLSELRHFAAKWRRLAASDARQSDVGEAIQTIPKVVAHGLLNAPGAWEVALDFAAQFK
ncbi:unnamed protein product, partial [Prorocentrum cordatum]